MRDSLRLTSNILDKLTLDFPSILFIVKILDACSQYSATGVVALLAGLASVSNSLVVAGPATKGLLAPIIDLSARETRKVRSRTWRAILTSKLSSDCGR